MEQGVNKKDGRVWPVIPVILVSLGLVAAIVWSIISGQNFSNQQLSLIFLLALVGLSLNFDKLAFGSLFSVERQVQALKAKQEELGEKHTELLEDNIKFRQDMVGFVARMAQNQSQAGHNTVNLGLPLVTPASQAELKAKAQEGSGEPESPEHEIRYRVESRGTPKPRPEEVPELLEVGEPSSRDFGAVEVAAICNSAQGLGIQVRDIVFDVRIDNAAGRVIARTPCIFDGYAKGRDGHYFFEVRAAEGMPLVMVDPVFRRVSEIQALEQGMEGRVKLILILVKGHFRAHKLFTPEDTYRRLITEFGPAMAKCIFRRKSTTHSG